MFWRSQQNHPQLVKEDFGNPQMTPMGADGSVSGTQSNAQLPPVAGVSLISLKRLITAQSRPISRSISARVSGESGDFAAQGHEQFAG
jgi:hypothetical protein